MLTYIILPNGRYYTTPMDGRINEFMFEFASIRGTRYTVPVRRLDKNNKNIAKPVGKIRRVPRKNINTVADISSDNGSNSDTGSGTGNTAPDANVPSLTDISTKNIIATKTAPVDMHLFIGSNAAASYMNTAVIAENSEKTDIAKLQEDLNNIAASKKAIIPDNMEGV
jgi:hypothetical protein